MSDVLYVNDAGIADALDVWTGFTGASLLSTAKVGLFKNNALTPGRATTLADVTGANEAAYPGYARISLSAFSAAAVAAHVATSSPATDTFVCTGGGSTESEYGGFIVDATGSVLLAVWEFSGGPFVMFNNGDTIQVSPTLSAQSLN